jgi:hypothetical protein
MTAAEFRVAKPVYLWRTQKPRFLRFDSLERLAF